MVPALNPLHQQIFAQFPTQYYWSAEQTEWAADVLFRDRAALLSVYDRLIRHATLYPCTDILRFLGRKLRADGQVPAHFNADLMADRKERLEGVRLKHWLDYNSLKMYDKDSILRAEATIQEPKWFRVYRPKEGAPDHERSWLPLRRSVADLHRRAEVSHAALDRYLAAAATLTDATPLKDLLEPLCQPATAPRRRSTRIIASTAPTTDATAVPTTDITAAPTTETNTEHIKDQPKSKRSRRVRALNPLAPDDAALLEAVSRSEFLLNGLRNRDLRLLLFPAPANAQQRHRQAAAVTRKLTLLRAHGILHKVPHTHRYQVSPTGRQATTALLAARAATTEALAAAA